ncbi:antitoxin Xre/MbcA/ParS toxin-binding domain-containing protein [Legionella gresilensis]|uniref:antitoxin Xre/MbcA/ParS toxin-binding domain-containing protein n=1 Tax=Legionella gresilensis TaxID=91823 RepID=UPI0010419429|nr:antitoxin Xre/MbcA/ParS toxin-binding domain-containing protein [Legionella gresilensis]
MNNSTVLKNSQSLDHNNVDNLKRNTANIIQLFKHWDLKVDEQCNLLGGISPQQLNNFQNGKAHISGRDTIERVGNLLGIHKSLRILYPYNRAVVYRWIKARNKKLHNLTPLEVMLSQGYIGIAQVRKLTDYMRGN